MEHSVIFFSSSSGDDGQAILLCIVLAVQVARGNDNQLTLGIPSEKKAELKLLLLATVFKLSVFTGQSH